MGLHKLVTLFTIMLPFFSFCQEERDNVIDIYKAPNPDLIFSILKDSGYVIKYDSDYKVFNTQPKRINDSVTIWLQIVVSKKTAMLTGMVRVNDTSNLSLNYLGNKEWYRTIEFNSGNDSIMQQAFDAIQSIAFKTKGRIRYHRMLSCFD